MQTVGSMCRGCAWVRGIGWLGSDASEFLNRGLFAKGWQDDVKCRVLDLHRDPCHQLVPYGARGVHGRAAHPVLGEGFPPALGHLESSFGAQDFFQVVAFGVFFSRFWVFFSWRSLRRGGGCWWSHRLH